MCTIWNPPAVTVFGVSMTIAFWDTSLEVPNFEVSTWSSCECQEQYVLTTAKDQSEIPVDAILRQPLPPTNLYFLSISRIHQVKHGPFHEHSSQLHSIATGVQHWSKVNSGLFKMYEVSPLCLRISTDAQLHHIFISDILLRDRQRCLGNELLSSTSLLADFSSGTFHQMSTSTLLLLRTGTACYLMAPVRLKHHGQLQE